MKVTILVSLLMLFWAGCSSKTNDSGGGDTGATTEVTPTPAEEVPTPTATPSPTPSLFGGMPKPLDGFFPTMDSLGIDETSFKNALATNAQANCYWGPGGNCSGISYMSALGIGLIDEYLNSGFDSIPGVYCRAKVLSEDLSKTEFKIESGMTYQYKITNSGIKIKSSFMDTVNLWELTFDGNQYLLKKLTANFGTPTSSSLASLGTDGAYKKSGTTALKYSSNGKVQLASRLFPSFSQEFSSLGNFRLAKVSNCNSQLNSCVYPVEGNFASIHSSLNGHPAGMYARALSKTGDITKVTVSGNEILTYDSMTDYNFSLCLNNPVGLHSDFLFCDGSNLNVFTAFGITDLTDSPTDKALSTKIYSDQTARDNYVFANLSDSGFTDGIDVDTPSLDFMALDMAYARCVLGY